jgi:tetratricopeptide (TPR) repeat protein
VIESLAGHWQAIVGAVGVAGLIGAWVRGWLLWLLPVSYPQAGRFLWFRWVEQFRWPVVAKEEGRFLVVVCCLDGDDATDSAMRVVARALRTEESLQPVLDWRRIAVGDSADQTRAGLRARRRALEVGAQYRADVIVWGEVAERGEGLRLHFQGAGQVMTRDLTISKGFLDAAYREPLNSLLGLIVATTTLAEVAALTNTGHFVANRLEPLAHRLERVLPALTPGLDVDRRAEIAVAYGLALAEIGVQRGDDQALHKAVFAFRQALTVITRERVPLDWAMTQNNLGTALAVLGERGDDAALNAAVTAYREALTVLTRERVPLDWAMTQNNLGTALAVLGERGDDAALREAVTAYREALEVRTRERVPLQWAMTQANLANALAGQAERSGDCSLIAEAISALDGAIEEFALREAPFNLAKARLNREVLSETARRLGCPEPAPEPLPR